MNKSNRRGSRYKSQSIIQHNFSMAKNKTN
nr:MAG TPA: hypothetical protein [Bacteriophage sp.]